MRAGFCRSGPRERGTANRRFMGRSGTSVPRNLYAAVKLPKSNQAGLEDRPVLLKTDFVSNYALRLLRSIRRVLAPNGSSSNAPAIIVVGSGTGAPKTCTFMSEFSVGAPKVVTLPLGVSHWVRPSAPCCVVPLLPRYDASRKEFT